MYKVIKAFTDLHDEDYPYSVGDSFPRVGIDVTEQSLKELSGCENKQGVPLIEKVADEALPAAVPVSYTHLDVYKRQMILSESHINVKRD